MLKSFVQNAAVSLALAPARLGEAASYCFAQARKLDARQVATFALAVAVLATVADPVFAQAAGGGTGGGTGGGGGDLTAFLHNLVNLLTGTAGKLISVLAICIVGIGALMGALSIRAAGGVVLGVMLVFSASWIVEQIVGT